MLNKNVNFNKSETECKLENPFRDTNLVLQLILELRIKNKTDELGLANESNVT